MATRHRCAQTRCAIAVCVAVLGSACLLAGCAGQTQDQLPRTHTDQAGQVAASHGRCGACHEGATRGNGTYRGLDYTGIESLDLSELAVQPENQDADTPSNPLNGAATETGVN